MDLYGLIIMDDYSWFDTSGIKESLSEKDINLHIEKWNYKNLVSLSDIDNIDIEDHPVDFILIDGAHQAEDVVSHFKKKNNIYTLLETPYVVATWKDLSSILRKNHYLLTENNSSMEFLNLEKILKDGINGKKWSDIDKIDQKTINSWQKSIPDKNLHLEIRTNDNDHDAGIYLWDFVFNDVYYIFSELDVLYTLNSLKKEYQMNSKDPISIQFENFILSGPQGNQMVLFKEADILRYYDRLSENNPMKLRFKNEIDIFFSEPTLVNHTEFISFNRNADILFQFMRNNSDIKYLFQINGFSIPGRDNQDFQLFVKKTGIYDVRDIKQIEYHKIEPVSLDIIKMIKNKLQNSLNPMPAASSSSG